MKGTGFATRVAVAAMTAGAGFAADGERHGDVAAAVILPAVSAASPSGDVRVTLVEGRANALRPLTVRALIVQPGALASWVLLPLTEIPQHLFVPTDESIVCVDRSLGSPRVVQLDLGGVEVRSRSLAALLPESSPRALDGAITLGFVDTGPCLAIDLGNRDIALVDLSEGHGGPLEVCSVVHNSRSSHGVEDWLRKSRNLLLEGNEVAAQTTLEAAKDAFPAEPRIYQQLARIHRSSGDPAAQLQCLEEGLRRSHSATSQAVTRDWQVGTPEARLVLDFVETTRKVRGNGEATKALGQALTLYPCMEQAVLLRAELLFSSGKDAEAIASLEEAVGALEGSEELGPALHDIGRFLERQGRDGAAIRCMKRAYEAGEFSEFLIRDIADLHVRVGRPVGAARWLTRLKNHWASVANGASEADRSRRGDRRLADLQREIEELVGSEAVVTDP